MWGYRDHQVEGAEWALSTLRQHALAYLAWEERTGKTGTAILTMENSTLETCLIVTKKKAIPGWEEAIAMFPTTKQYTVINYESVHKVKGKFDLIILDEAHHAISGMPKPSLAWKRVFPLCKGKPILYLSATPYAEHMGLIYHQLKLSTWTPLKSRSFYDFHRVYGIPDIAYTPTPRETYKKYDNDKILTFIKHLFNFKTRSDVGIEHEPSVLVKIVRLDKLTKDRMKDWVRDRLLTIGDETIPNDSPGKARSVHYQLEGGTLKDVGFISTEKIRYIKENYDVSKIAIMAHFILERELLERELPGVRILSSDGDAEGVDLSMIEKLLVYSMSDKTSKYTQRLARQANHNRNTPIVVDILVGDAPGIGMNIYKAVALKKENFVKASYEQALKELL